MRKMFNAMKTNNRNAGFPHFMRMFCPWLEGTQLTLFVHEWSFIGVGTNDNGFGIGVQFFHVFFATATHHCTFFSRSRPGGVPPFRATVRIKTTHVQRFVGTQAFHDLLHFFVPGSFIHNGPFHPGIVDAVALHGVCTAAAKFDGCMQFKSVQGYIYIFYCIAHVTMNAMRTLVRDQ